MKRFGVVLLAVGLVACGDDPVPGVGTVVRMRVAADGRAPAYGDVPMPTDALRSSDRRLAPLAGLEDVAPLQTDSLRGHFAALDGFGVRPAVEFFLDGGLDPDTLPQQTAAAGDPAVLVDVDPGSPHRYRVVPMDWRYDASRGVLAGAPVPGVVLREGNRYAALVTTALRGVDGGPIARSAALDRLAGPASPERWRSTAEVVEALVREGGIDRATLAGIAVFTTQRASAPLLAARGVLDELPPPGLSFPDPSVVFGDPGRLDQLLGQASRDASGAERWGWSNPTGIAHDHVGVVATGRMTTVRFTRDPAGDLGPEDQTFDLDEGGTPRVIEAAHQIPVTLVLPAQAAPATGYPVAIFGHGLAASRHAILTFAEPLTRAGFAIAAIDLADFGSRFEDVDQKNNLDFLPEFSGDPDLPDGFGDTTGPVTTFAFLRGLVGLSAVRDSIRQSVLDLGQLARLLRRDDLDLSALAGAYGGAAPRLDARRIAYLGESYGSLVGGVFAAVEPEVDLFVLDVPGGGILDLEIANSPGIGTLVIPLARSVYGIEGRFDRFHPMVAIGQAILDAADPLTYAPHVLADRSFVGKKRLGPRSVVAIEVIGDELIPNLATHALARAMGLPLLEPYLVPVEGTVSVASPASADVDGQSAALVQYSPATHGSNWTSEVGTLSFYPDCPRDGGDPFPRLPAPIEIPNPIHATFDQVVEILETHQAGPSPVIRSTVAPVADFDADGMSDAEEIAIGRDPLDPSR